MAYEHNERVRKRVLLTLVWEGTRFCAREDASHQEIRIRYQVDLDEWEVEWLQQSGRESRSSTYRFDGEGRLTQVFHWAGNVQEADPDQIQSNERESVDLMGRVEWMRQTGKIRVLER